MPVDPENPVAQLCVKGLEAEMRGERETALSLYVQAWDARKDAYDACIASHYVARLQTTTESRLRWNQESLGAADLVLDERVAEFYPSLYLNLGKAYEDIGNRDEARRNYQLAESRLAALPAGRYADVVKRGVANGLARVTTETRR
jgi:tetratricopeptide (TPR) repeat protein